jgi:hypothetical protein
VNGGNKGTAGKRNSLSPKAKTSAVSVDLCALCVKPLSYIAAVCDARGRDSFHRQTLSISGAETRVGWTSRILDLSVKFAEV